MPQPKIFVSHSSKDTPFATQLVNDLNAAGAHAWLDVNDIVAGDFMDRINAALKECEWFVLVLTENALKARWVPKEVNVALNLERQGRIHDLIFVKAGPIEHNEIPPMWSTITYTDATADYQAALNRVLKAVGLQLSYASQLVWSQERSVEFARHMVEGALSRHLEVITVNALSRRMLTRNESGMSLIEVGDIVRKLMPRSHVIVHGPSIYDRLGVVCAAKSMVAEVSWYVEIQHEWLDQESVPPDQLVLVDFVPRASRR